MTCEKNNYLLDEVTTYWKNRSESYCQTNLEEFQSFKKEAWQNLILDNSPQKETLRILDIGTGPGFLAIIMAMRGHEVHAMDATEEMLKRASANADNYDVSINLACGDAHMPPYQDNSFDVVLSRNVTWNLEQPEIALKQWQRITKKGGRVIYFDANWYLYLFDDIFRTKYEEDRKKIRDLGYHDHCSEEVASEMEKIARNLPLSKQVRPEWDKKTLADCGFEKIYFDADITSLVWDEKDMAEFGSTPLFMAVAQK